MSHIEIAVFEALRSVTPNYKGPLAADTRLGADGIGLDSIGFLELILEIEQRINVRLRDASLIADALATPDSLIRHIERSLSTNCEG